MKKIYFFLLLQAIVCSIIGGAYAQQTSTGGGITGDVNATLEGQTDPIVGKIDAQWSFTQTSTGGTSILASGSMAGKGFSADFNWIQDEQGNSKGSWTVPGSSGYGGTFSLDVNTLTCIFSGTIPGGSGQGALKLSGSGVLVPQGSPTTQLGGPLSGNIGGTIDATASGMAVTGSFSGLTSGNWYVSAYSASDMSGTMNASFSGTAVTDPIGALGPTSAITIPIKGSIDGTFKMDKDGALSFVGQTNYSVESQGVTTDSLMGFDFNIPLDMSQGIKMAGSIPFTGSQDISVPVLGSLTVNYTINSTFDISLIQGDPSTLAPVQITKSASNVWYITGTIPDQNTCSGGSGSTLGFNGAPINVTAHGATLTGSSGNPADTSQVYGNSLISEPGSFSIAIADSVSSATVFIFSDTDFSGSGSPGDIGGHYCDGTTGNPGVINSPGAGNTIDISGFVLGVLPVQISGDVIIDTDALNSVGMDTKIVAQVYDNSGNLLDYSYNPVSMLSFGVWVNGANVGDAITVKVFIDTNGNGTEDGNEPTGTASHQVSSSAGGNDKVLVTLQ